MKVLLVFDSHKILYPWDKLECRHLDVFPLTSNSDINQVVSELGEQLNIPINLLNSGEIINYKAQNLRDEYIEWAAEIGNCKIGSKKLRELLMLSDGNISAWWFSLLADKDPAKSNAFFRIVQTAAVIGQAQNGHYDLVILALKDGNFGEKLKLVLSSECIKCQLWRVNKERLFYRVKDKVKQNGFIRAAWALLTICGRLLHLRIKLPSLKQRNLETENALLFISYFPYVLPKEAQEGIFRNRYILPLQDIYHEHGKPIVSGLIYTYIDNYSFADAVKLAKRFIHNGEPLFFYEEFLSLKLIANAFIEYMRIRIAWSKVSNKLSELVLEKKPGNDFALPFLLELLNQSFTGFYLIQGILQYYAFNNMFRKLNNQTYCLYYSEMMNWEYALIAAKRYSDSGITTIGYMHSSLSRNYLQMYHSQKELEDKNTPAGIPMPDIFACNGKGPKRMLSQYYQDIVELEALRYLHIYEYLQFDHSKQQPQRKDKFILLVCTTIDAKESITIVDLVVATFWGNQDGVEIWFKGHPSLSVDSFMPQTGAGYDFTNYEIKYEAIADLMPECDAVLVGASTVAIEALAFGREVLVYINAGTLNQSPLIGYNECYHEIYDQASFREAIDNIRTQKEHDTLIQKLEFVKEYWSLDPHLNAWKQLLGFKIMDS